MDTIDASIFDVIFFYFAITLYRDLPHYPSGRRDCCNFFFFFFIIIVVIIISSPSSASLLTAYFCLRCCVSLALRKRETTRALILSRVKIWGAAPGHWPSESARGSRAPANKRAARSPDRDSRLTKCIHIHAITKSIQARTDKHSKSIPKPNHHFRKPRHRLKMKKKVGNFFYLLGSFE